MKFKLALVAAPVAVALGVWAQVQLNADERGAAAAVAQPVPLAGPAAKAAPPVLAAEPARTAPRPPVAARAAAPAPRPAIEPLAVEQAQALMAELAAQGDSRQPAAGGLRPRVAASAAQLADAEQYSAFEAAARRREVQAWTLGLQQIPHIRERIDQAAFSGERSSAELAEASQALEQLELLQQSLQQSDPQLLQAPQRMTD